MADLGVMTAKAAYTLSPLERRVLNLCQQDFPLSPTPYRDMADVLGVDESLVLATLKRLQEAGVLARVGGVVRSGRVGASTLAAMRVPVNDLERVAAVVNGFDEVNHNYERTHDINLWFVVVAPDATRLDEVLQRIEQDAGYPVLRMPMREQYHIDLGFAV